MKVFVAVFLALCALVVNAKLLKNPSEVSHLSPNQLLSYVQHVETISRAVRDGADKGQCYDYYLPKLADATTELDTNRKLCDNAYDVEEAKKLVELESSKSAADGSSDVLNTKLSKCKDEKDPQKSLECHSESKSNVSELKQLSNNANLALRTFNQEITKLQNDKTNCKIDVATKGDSKSQEIYDDLFNCIATGEIKGEESNEDEPEEDLSGM